MEMKTVPSVISTYPGTHTYTACYCEENVWKLCELLQNSCSESELSKCFCVFISNMSRQIPLWHQKASKNKERLVIWDYHVILVYGGEEAPLVYDLDTELMFPCSLKEYVAACIGEESTLQEKFRRMFRVIPAEEFLMTFASDRSHMLDEKGLWMSPPPNYPPISCPDCTDNIQQFISMEETHRHGTVLNLQQFIHRFNVTLT